MSFKTESEMISTALNSSLFQPEEQRKILIQTEKEGLFGRPDILLSFYTDGAFLDNEIITWIIPKDAIGNPRNGQIIENIVPHTHLRYPESSGIPMWDLFKDLPWNAKVTKDYILEY